VALVAFLIIAQEQLDRLVGEGLGDLMKGATGRVGRPGVEATLERSTDRVQIAVTRGREDPVAVALVDGGLEVPPAGEAVLAGDDQLGVAQPGRGILGSHFPEALLGFVPEMFEIGASGKLA
jgi:hypothetical protein